MLGPRVHVVVERTGERLVLPLPPGGVLDLAPFMATGQVRVGDRLVLHTITDLSIDMDDPPLTPTPARRGRVPAFIATRNARHFRRKARR